MKSCFLSILLINILGGVLTQIPPAAYAWPLVRTPAFDSVSTRHWGASEITNQSADVATGWLSAMADASGNGHQSHAEAGVIWNFHAGAQDTGQCYLKITDYSFAAAPWANTGPNVAGGGMALGLLYLRVKDVGTGDIVEKMVRREGQAMTSFGLGGAGSYTENSPMTVEFTAGHDYEISAVIEATALQFAECPESGSGCAWGSGHCDVQATIREITVAPSGRPWITVRYVGRARQNEVELDTWDAYESLLAQQGSDYFNDTVDIVVNAGGRYDFTQSYVEADFASDLITGHSGPGANDQVCGNGDRFCIQLPDPVNLPWWGGRWEFHIDLDPEIDQFHVGYCYIPFPLAVFLEDDSAVMTAAQLYGYPLEDFYDFASWQVMVDGLWMSLPRAVNEGSAWSATDPNLVAFGDQGGLLLQTIADVTGIVFQIPTFENLVAWLESHCRGWDSPPNIMPGTKINPFFRFGENSYAESRDWTLTGFVTGQIDTATLTDTSVDKFHLQVNWDYWPRTLYQVPSPVPAEQNLGATLAASPNPFNPRVKLDFDLSHPGPVTLTIFDLRGNQVQEIRLGPRDQGEGSATWDGSDSDGLQVPAGVYLVRLQQGKSEQVAKIALIR